METSSGLTRRDVIKLGATSAISLAGASMLSGCTSASPSVSSFPKIPKNVIFMVSDGMSMGVPSLAEPFSQLVRRKPTQWYRLAQNKDVTQGWFETASLNSMVTDSAPASSAWGSGSRVFNRVINYLPDGQRLTPLGPLALAAGRKVGVVTTATVTHATPAGFLAAHQNRDAEDDIASQYLKIAPDLIMGGGSFFFSADGRDDNQDLAGEFAQAGYMLLTQRDHLRSAPSTGKILGLFDPSFLPYTLDWKNNPRLESQVPTLAEMTEVALKNLQNATEGFLLQVEGARVDHAAHANDPGALLWDQLAFDDAIAVVLEFVKDRPDTLVVITSDHGNSNPGLNGMSPNYDQSTQCFSRIANFNTSFATLRDELSLNNKSRPRMDPSHIAAMVFAATQIALKEKEAKDLFEACNNRAEDHNDQHASIVGLLGEFTGNHTGIGWTGTTHTADLVPILAVGSGREAYQGLMKNTDNYDRLAPLLGITHRNPTMTVEESKKYLETPAQASPEEKPHWLIGNY